VLIAGVLVLAAGDSAHARSKAAEYLIREQIAEACEGQPGQIEPSAVIERDLTGDGKADLIISHEGITCSGGGRSLMCGAQVCSVMVYVREGSLLKLRVGDRLGAGVRVRPGEVPTISMHGHGGREGGIRWDGRSFQPVSRPR
jgi:hypothetical protein